MYCSINSLLSSTSRLSSHPIPLASWNCSFHCFVGCPWRLLPLRFIYSRKLEDSVKNRKIHYIIRFFIRRYITNAVGMASLNKSKRNHESPDNNIIVCGRPVGLVDTVYCYCCDGARLCLCGTGPLAGPLSILQMIIWKNIEQQWNDTNRGKPKDSEINLSQCHFVHQKSNMDWPKREPGTPRWNSDD
jgi:hypothetical protein